MFEFMRKNSIEGEIPGVVGKTISLSE